QLFQKILYVHEHKIVGGCGATSDIELHNGALEVRRGIDALVEGLHLHQLLQSKGNLGFCFKQGVVHEDAPGQLKQQPCPWWLPLSHNLPSLVTRNDWLRPCESPRRFAACVKALELTLLAMAW